MTTNTNLSLGESLALAILKGDKVAAYALADMLLEERARGSTPLDHAYQQRFQGAGLPDGYTVYHWPEFQALAKRLGLLYDLYTYDTTIEIPVEGLVKITQSYRGNDSGPQSSPTASTGGESAMPPSSGDELGASWVNTSESTRKSSLTHTGGGGGL